MLKENSTVCLAYISVRRHMWHHCRCRHRLPRERPRVGTHVSENCWDGQMLTARRRCRSFIPLITARNVSGCSDPTAAAAVRSALCLGGLRWWARRALVALAIDCVRPPGEHRFPEIYLRAAASFFFVIRPVGRFNLDIGVRRRRKSV